MTAWEHYQSQHLEFPQLVSPIFPFLIYIKMSLQEDPLKIPWRFLPKEGFPQSLLSSAQSLFLQEGLHLRYAQKYLKPEQIEEVDIASFCE